MYLVRELASTNTLCTSHDFQLFPKSPNSIKSLSWLIRLCILVIFSDELDLFKEWARKTKPFLHRRVYHCRRRGQGLYICITEHLFPRVLKTWPSDREQTTLDQYIYIWIGNVFFPYTYYNVSLEVLFKSESKDVLYVFQNTVTTPSERFFSFKIERCWFYSLKTQHSGTLKRECTYRRV